VTAVFFFAASAGRAGLLGCLQAKGAAQMGSSSEPLSRGLYAQVEPYDSGFLKVSDVHTIYYEQSGNPQGHVSV